MPCSLKTTTLQQNQLNVIKTVVWNCDQLFTGWIKKVRITDKKPHSYLVHLILSISLSAACNWSVWPRQTLSVFFHLISYCIYLGVIYLTRPSVWVQTQASTGQSEMHSPEVCRHFSTCIIHGTHLLSRQLPSLLSFVLYSDMFSPRAIIIHYKCLQSTVT